MLSYVCGQEAVPTVRLLKVPIAGLVMMRETWLIGSAGEWGDFRCECCWKDA